MADPARKKLKRRQALVVVLRSWLFILGFLILGLLTLKIAALAGLVGRSWT
jgi:hypothetical protein